MKSSPPLLSKTSSAIAKGRKADVPEPQRYTGIVDRDRVDPDAAKVVRRLVRAGHNAYLVGGGVRDMLLKQRPKDFDVATSAHPQEVRALFRNCRIIGRRFRLAHVLFGGGKIIEVATFRRDPRDGDEGPSFETIDHGDGVRFLPSKRSVSEDADLLIRQDNVFGLPHEDAVRRDFTINGLFYDLERDEVIDYVGGVRDVNALVVRTIGDPAIRFREDPIRILRAIKFSARLDLGLEPTLFDAMVDQREGLTRASPPRTFEEILRLLRGGAAQRSIYLMWDMGLLAVLLPELAAYLDDVAVASANVVFARLGAVDKRARAGNLPADPLLVSALLFSPAEEYMDGERDPLGAFDAFVEDMAQRFTIPRRMRERMRLLMGVQLRIREGRVGNLARREFFADSATLHGIDCEARGLPVPDWTEDVSLFKEREPKAKKKKPASERAEP